ASADPLATKACLAILAAGGNAFDAALCGSMILAVTLPMSCGIGGDGVFLCWDAKNRVSRSINALGIVPANTDPIRSFLLLNSKRLADGSPSIPPKTGMLTASVPALPYGWESLSQMCSLAIEDIARPAISLARDGFLPDAKFRRWAAANFSVFRDDPYLVAMFGSFAGTTSGNESALLKQPELADFLDLFSRTVRDENPSWRDTFIAEVVGASNSGGGAMNDSDFLAPLLAQASFPVTLDINNTTVLSSGATTQGYLALLAAKMIGESLKSGRSEILGAAKVFHALYCDKSISLGDRGVNQELWLQEKVRTAHSLAQDAEKLDFRTISGSSDFSSGDTTQFYTVDDRGNAVCGIQSLSLAFGSGKSAPPLGLIFNSRLGRGISLKSTAPNALISHSRPVNTIFPILGVRDGGLHFLGGSPGGDIQVQINAQAVRLLATEGSLDRWPKSGRWKYGPVADVFDPSYVERPTIIFECEVETTLRTELESAGLVVSCQNDVGGNARYGYVSADGRFNALDEGRDGGLSAII
ncbi:MAG: gamma-glutamyltransferase, partial [Xanthobacteraceae bacterium]